MSHSQTRYRRRSRPPEGAVVDTHDRPRVPRDRHALTRADLLSLQRTMGNRAVARLVRDEDRWTRSERWFADEATNTKFLRDLWPRFYAVDGKRHGDYDKNLKGLYSELGKAPADDYLKKRVSRTDWRKFTGKHKSYSIKTQSSFKFHGKKTKQIDSATAGRALKKGDYFHVHNNNANKLARGDALKGTARRIIVNVKTQQHALDVAKALTDMFRNKNGPGQWIREFKMYLSDDSSKTEIKKDKMVVYYRLPTGEEGSEREDMKDSVGKAIVEAIQGAVSRRNLVTEFAPFYARVAPGIAWGEEPKYHIDLPKGSGTSFTQSRTELIKEYIERHDVVASADAFLEQINDHFASRGVDPYYPASHLRAPEPQQEEEEPPDDQEPEAPRDEAQDQGAPELIDERDPDAGA